MKQTKNKCKHKYEPHYLRGLYTCIYCDKDLSVEDYIEITEVKKTLKRLAKAVVAVCKNQPSVACSSFHHRDGDLHLWNEECKPMSRYFKAMGDATKLAVEVLK